MIKKFVVGRIWTHYLRCMGLTCYLRANQQCLQVVCLRYKLLMNIKLAKKKVSFYFRFYFRMGWERFKIRITFLRRDIRLDLLHSIIQILWNKKVNTAWIWTYYLRDMGLIRFLWANQQYIQGVWLRYKLFMYIKLAPKKFLFTFDFISERVGRVLAQEF